MHIYYCILDKLILFFPTNLNMSGDSREQILADFIVKLFLFDFNLKICLFI